MRVLVLFSLIVTTTASLPGRIMAQGFAASAARVGAQGEVEAGPGLKLTMLTAESLVAPKFNREQIDFLTRRRLSGTLVDPSLKDLLDKWVRLLSDLHQSGVIQKDRVLWLVKQVESRKGRGNLPQIDSTNALFDDLQREVLGLKKPPAGPNFAQPAGRTDSVRAVNSAPVDVSLQRAQLDSLRDITTTFVLRRITLSKFFLPVNGRRRAEIFWEQPGTSTIGTGGAAGGFSQGAAYTELVSPLIHAFRLSVNGVIAAARDDKAQAEPPPDSGATVDTASAAGLRARRAQGDVTPDFASVERFLNGGGLFNVGAMYPVFHVGQSRTHAFDVTLLAAPRFGAAIPIGGGAAARDTSLLWDAGAELHAKSSDVVSGVGAFVTLRTSYADGTKAFHEAIGRTSTSAFWYSRLTAGILFGGAFQLLLTRTLGGPSGLKDVGTELSFTIIQKGKAPKTAPAAPVDSTTTLTSAPTPGP